MRPEETVPDVPSNTGASSSSGSKEAQEKRGAKRVSENDGRADLDEAQLEMARQAAEAGLAIARKRGEKRSETTVTEREVRARIPESRGQKRISENDGRVDLDEADSEMATKNTRVGQVHISTTAIRWCDVNDEMENDPLVNLETWKSAYLQNIESSYNDPFTVERVANLRKKEVCIEGRALREAPHVSRKVVDFDPSTEIPLLTVPSDASTRDAEKAWVPSISVGIEMGVEHVERGKPNGNKTRGYVCIGGLDTNDLDETEECFDAYETNGYLDERTGLMLDEALTKQAEAEEVEFMQKIRLYDVVSNSECWDKTGRPPISTKWVRVNKGTQEAPDIRCRLVARDFKPKGEKDRSEIFA